MKKPPLLVYDRQKKSLFEEKIYGGAILHLLYDHKTIIRRTIAAFFARISFCSYFYGFLQNLWFSRFKINSFIQDYNIDTTEFYKKNFTSFNDFFTRKLKPNARPISNSPLIAPADGRYLAIKNLHKNEGLFIKGEKFSLLELLKFNEKAFNRYKHGSLILARLAPPDYHRFHFPLNCSPCNAILENRYLFSVNPIALKNNIHILTQNKRYKIELNTEEMGNVLMYCIGATNVGSMHFSYQPHIQTKKGHEAGYFSFGGSMILMLFEKGKVNIAREILEQSEKGIETYCKMGESLTEPL